MPLNHTRNNSSESQTYIYHNKHTDTRKPKFQFKRSIVDLSIHFSFDSKSDIYWESGRETKSRAIMVMWNQKTNDTNKLIYETDSQI